MAEGSLEKTDKEEQYRQYKNVQNSCDSKRMSQTLSDTGILWRSCSCMSWFYLIE